ncbi:MAG: AMP-binding protein, partial [Bacteroidota bacterium]
YYKLIAYWEKLDKVEQAEISKALASFRLMVSGSAALPISVLKKWRAISGHTLLERYGMNEIGMAVSNSYRGERRPGHIGLPLPGLALRLVDEHNQPVELGKEGEIQVKGPSIFLEYWQKEEATKEAFTKDGWFKTGDVGLFNEGSYRILGRSSVDIIKSGGYKISALEIEEQLRKHPLIKDCGVVGIPDEEWGEIVAASLVLENEAPDLKELQLWLKERMPAYRVPRKYIFQEDLPRNTLGKVTKNELKKLF